MSIEKVYKAGTVVRLYYTCNFASCDGYDEFTLDRDMTETELNKIAYEGALKHVQPEGWFEVSDE